MYAARQARDANLEGLVAVVDGDRDGRSRLRVLTKAREEDRQNAFVFPTAIGCALPHVEAWLVSDREALEVFIPAVAAGDLDAVHRSKRPKEALDRACKQARMP